jgi:hypothetical protein
LAGTPATRDVNGSADGADVLPQPRTERIAGASRDRECSCESMLSFGGHSMGQRPCHDDLVVVTAGPSLQNDGY